MAKKPDPRKKKKAPRRTRMIALEPRMLFDGALGIDLGVKASAALQADAGAPAADAAAEQSSAESKALLAALPEDATSKPAQATEVKESEHESLEKPAGQRTELVFVDPTVSDPDALLAGVNPDMRVFLLDPGRDAIAQIAEVVSQYPEGQIDAIHLIAHGSEGRINFGSGVLDAATMQGTHAEALAQIGRHLSGDADILVYGCNFGQGEEGRVAAEQLAQITGADVAASDDATGHAGLGGDWDLETWVGSIESEVPLSPAANEGWWNLLADVTLHSYEPTFAELADTSNEIKSDQNWGQTFTYDSPGATYSVDKIGLVLYRASDASAQTITVSLRSSWNGAVIASGTVASGSLGTAEAWVTVNLSAAATLNDNTSYYLRVESSDATGKVYLGTNQAGTYAGGDLIDKDGNAQAGKDAAFRIIDADDGPVNAVPGAQSVNEDTALSIAGVSVSDLDGNLATAQLTVTNGTLNVSLAGGAAISAGANGSSILTLSGTQAQINAALASLSYQGGANFNGSDTLTVLSTDTNGATDADAVSITVASVNDGPINTMPGAQTVTEDTPLAIAGISVNDIDGNLSSTRLTVSAGTLNVSLAGGASISAGTNGSSTLTLSGTQAQINAALASLSYQGNADFAGGDTLTVVSTDANGATDSDSLAITVTAVNDAPAVTSATAGTFAENTTGAVYTATRADPDAGDTVTWTLAGPDAALFSIDPTTGVVTLSAAQSFAAPADANGDGIYDITVRATDGSGQFDQRNVQLTLTEASIAQPQLPSTGTALPASVPAASTAPQLAPPLQPLAPRVGEPALGLPVDGGVAPANLAGSPVPASWSAAPAAVVASQFDLNALPPTAAGQPSTFSLTRLPQEQALAYLRADDLKAPAINGHYLFVYQGVPDLRLLADGPAMLRVPTDAFAHTDSSAVVHLEARLANGNPLPGWLRFDGLRGVFSGTPPQGIEETLEVEIIARDTEGREARTQFTLEIEAMRLRAAAGDLALGMEVDKEEVEKARLEAARQASEGRAATQVLTATAGIRPGKAGAASFSDQVSAAKTQRDPLLDRIAPSDKAKPGTRR